MFNLDPLSQIAKAVYQNIISNSPIRSPSPRYNPQFNGWQSASEMPTYSPTPIQPNTVPLPPHSRRLPPLARKPISNQFSPPRNNRIHHRSFENKKQNIGQPSSNSPKTDTSNKNQNKQTRNKSIEVNNNSNNMKYYNTPVPYVPNSDNNNENNKKYKKLEFNPFQRLQFGSREKDRKEGRATNNQTPEKRYEKKESIDKRPNSMERITASQMDRLLE